MQAQVRERMQPNLSHIRNAFHACFCFEAILGRTADARIHRKIEI
jgi:hypothetical protein